jgi:3-oxoacyl-[acyl-carrier protein] reductase
LDIAPLAPSKHFQTSLCYVNHLIITGGKGGLATAVAEAFVAPDWKVAAPGRADLDVTDFTAVNRFFRDRPLDLLVCAAGITRDAALPRLSPNAWDEVMAVNFRGASACARAALPAMIARGTGHVVFISSRSAVHPPAGQASYATAKAALLGLAADLARETGLHGIRVNTVFPGFLETPMTRTVTAPRRQEILADHVLGRFNTTAAVARFLHFLHHDLPHTSGQMFQLDSRLGS